VGVAQKLEIVLNANPKPNCGATPTPALPTRGREKVEYHRT
jgi:hypothetical protein